MKCSSTIVRNLHVDVLPQTVQPAIPLEYVTWFIPRMLLQTHRNIRHYTSFTDLFLINVKVNFITNTAKYISLRLKHSIGCCVNLNKVNILYFYVDDLKIKDSM